MRLLLVHARVTFLTLFRLPVFVASTVTFPLVLFLFVGYPQAHSAVVATSVAVGFAAYAIVGVTVFQFGVGVSNEREAPWEYFVRTLPVPAGTRLAARAGAGLAFGVMASVPVVLLAGLLTPVHLDLQPAAEVTALLLFGGVVFGLFGMSIGYWVRARSSVAVANLLYYPLAFLGRLFDPRESFPRGVDQVSRALPVRMWSDALYGVVRGGGVDLAAVAGLVAWGCAFGVVALIGYRRDEQRKYR